VQSRLPLIIAGFWWFLLIGAAQAMNGPLGLTICEKLGGPKGGESSMTALFFIGDTCMIMASSWFARRFSVRNMAIAYALIFVFGATGAWLAPTWATVLPALLVLGVGYGGASVLYNAEFSMQFPEDRKVQWLLVLNGFWGVGAVVGPWIVGTWITTPRVPHLLLFVGGIVGLAWALMMKPGGVASEAHEGSSVKNPRVWWYALVMAIYVGAEVSVGMLAARHLFEFHHLSMKTAVYGTTTLWLVYSIARFVLGPVVAKVGPRKTVIGASIAGGILLIATKFVDQPLFVLPLVGMCMAPIFPAVMSLASSEGGDEHRTAAILITTAGLGAVSVPYLVSYAVGGGPLMPLVVGTLFALAGGVALAIQPLRRVIA
jgi:fucose permease